MIGTPAPDSDRIVRAARAGGALGAGEGKTLIERYEAAIRTALATGDPGALDAALRFGRD